MSLVNLRDSWHVAVLHKLDGQLFSDFLATYQLPLLFKSGMPTAAVGSIAACQLSLLVQ
jgi:hypothetical protein